MKQRFIAVPILAAGIVLTGCYTEEGRPDYTANGALAGGAIGAGTGAIIGGAAAHNAGAGALIGGAVGVVSGALIGHSIDEQQRARIQQESPATWQRVEQGQPLGLADVKELARAGVSDEVIISQIRNSHSVYQLSTAEIIDLKNSGVSERVIDFMINTSSGYNVAPPPPPPYGAPAESTIVTQPPPPPIVEEYYPAPSPGYVWIPGAWTWYGGRWVWVRGRWAWPPRRRAIWIGGRWEPRGGSGVWIAGHWG
ncbi:MAG TPA: YXWGXW repeat-containing protein [Verrucomicrobiae bacterium]|nr:YXWGXW repeat-containing protein [Verrucomicrobiae bacterium]